MQSPSPGPTPSPPSEPTQPARNASLLEVAGAVFSSFLGIRKGKAMRRDAITIRPHQVVLVGIGLAAIFVVSLILFVRLVIRLAGA
jgi:hypothetical protein